jgi:hypothetical protein
MSQKVRTLGFKLDFADRIKFGHVAAALIEKTGQEVNHYGGRSIVYVDIVDNVFVGLVLSFKGNRKFMNSMMDSRGKFLVKKMKLAENEHGIEAAVFCVNPITGSGLFTSYWGGVGSSKLRMIFDAVHKEIRTEVIDQYITAGIEDGEDKRELRKQANKIWIKNKMDLTVICNKAEFEEVIAMYSRVSGLRVSLSPALLDAKWFSPISASAGSTALSVTMKKDSPSKGVIGAVRTMFDSKYRDKVTSLRIIGSSLEGEDLDHIVGAAKIEFGACTYDEYLDKMPANSFDEFQECPAIKEILSCLQEHRPVFGRTPANRNWLPEHSVQDISLEYEE